MTIWSSIRKDLEQAVEEAALAMKRTAPVRGTICSPTGDYLHRRNSSRPGWRHAAIDIGAPLGSPVYAPESGEIFQVVGKEKTEKKRTHFYHYGPKVIILKGDSGMWHWLCHLGSTSVSSGDTVEAGQPIGTIGKIGKSGPHVHWEVRKKTFAKYGRVTPKEWPWRITVDPLLWVHGRTKDAISISDPWPANRNIGVVRDTTYPIVLRKSKLSKEVWKAVSKPMEFEPMIITRTPGSLWAEMESKPSLTFPAPVDTGLGFILVLGVIVYFSMRQK